MAGLLCFAAMLGYALEISVTDWKLSDQSPRLLTFWYSLGMVVLALVNLLVHRDPIAAPAGREWGFVLLMIAASFGAAWAHFAALHAGSGATMLALFYCVMPVAAAAFMFFFDGTTPNGRTMLAWLFAAVGLYLAATASP